MTRQAIIKNSGNDRIAIESPYDADFVRDLKAGTASRKWDAAAKVWTVTADEAQAAGDIAGKYFQVVDARRMSRAEVEDARLAAEIEKIRADQRYILEQRAWLEEAIEALDADIKRYSYRSRSAVKARKAHDRALFRHALDYAEMPVEHLTEMQVRSLAAARRVATNNSIPALLARS